MASTIQVDKIQDTGGNTILSSNGTGTFTSNLPLGNGTPYFMARLSGDQSIADNTETVVTFNSEDYDSGGCFDTTTYRFTPNVEGHYFIASRLTISGTSPNEGSCQIRIDGNKDNGANWYTVSANSTATYYASFVRYANGSSTYFDVLAYFNVDSGSGTVKSTTQSNFFGWRIA